MNPATRHYARFYALQALYQWQLSGAPINDIEIDFLTHHIKKKTDLDYFKELIYTIPRIKEELDERMKAYLSRPLSELDPVELAVLRIGTYELIHRLDIPYRVSINESLELTKKFGSIEGYKFVNGILDQVARQHRSLEVSTEKKKAK